MAAIAMKPFLTPSLCANIDQVVDAKTEPCQKAADLACGACKLVQYCSKECQKAHWARHKKQCKSDLMQPKYVPAWIREGRAPEFLNPNAKNSEPKRYRYLWGNMPALDILKMKDNEGLKDLGRNMSLLFAASGDCRNVVKTIVELPEGYTGKLKVVVNDKDFAVVARNVILLLSALCLDPETSVPIMIHLWYSAFIPSVMLEILQTEVLPYIHDVCAKVKNKPPGWLKEKTFEFPNGSLRLVLSKEQWDELASFFKVPEGLTREAAMTDRQQTTLDNIDHIDRELHRWPPGKRMGNQKFLREGILLPFGCSTAMFDTPNPTFFRAEGWTLPEIADPLKGWLYADYTLHASIATADVYGSLFFFLRDLFLKFCRRVQNTRISFRFYNVDAKELSEYLPRGGKAFDRIENTNICDRCYIGPAWALSTFAPLLRPKAQNPKATLLMLFMNAVEEIEMNRGLAYVEVEYPKRKERLEKIIGRWPPTGERHVVYHPEFLQRSMLTQMFADLDEMFDAFWKETWMNELAEIEGVQIKEHHSLVEKWPYRVTPSTSRENSEIMTTLSLAGRERYVELERTERRGYPVEPDRGHSCRLGRMGRKQKGGRGIGR